ncbi:pinin-like [Uloborus diversus]|uniref:pinin-like n=1 Tax=Uloborus diversus TaxID=327109 RepID=UPI002409B072|nr:pinin-like [Uloborus diversus]
MQQDTVSFQSLLERFETTKKELLNTEQTIRRITGRDPDSTFPQSSAAPAGRPGLFVNKKRPRFPIKPQEREPTPEEYESPDEDGGLKKKPSIQSTVVAAAKDVKSRRDVIHEQNINSKVTARNRRMMGLVLGTLQKFQNEEKKRKEQVLKKIEKEQKVEAAAEVEKEQMKKEKEELFHNRKEKQCELRCLEKKLEIAEVYEVWQKSYKNMLNYITTKAKPHICYLPAVLDSKSKKCLEESKAKALELLEEYRTNTEQELVQIEEWYKKEPFPQDKENTPDVEDPNDIPEAVKEMLNPEPKVEEKTPPNPDDGPSVPETIPEFPVESEEQNTMDTETAEENIRHAVDQEFEPIYD